MIIRRTFEDQLQELQNDLLRLGRFVEESLGKALDAFARQDFALAQQVIADDDLADDMDFNIQASAMQLLALQQPMARDLRIIGASLRIVVDLERIGDHAVDLAKVVRSPTYRAALDSMQEMAQLGELSRKMVRDALQSLIHHDTILAVQIARDDDAVDELCEGVQQSLMNQMRDDIARVEPLTGLLLVARSLERVADHATNIAEYSYYIETGEMRNLAREEHGYSATADIIADHHKSEIAVLSTPAASSANGLYTETNL